VVVVSNTPGRDSLPRSTPHDNADDRPRGAHARRDARSGGSHPRTASEPSPMSTRHRSWGIVAGPEASRLRRVRVSGQAKAALRTARGRADTLEGDIARLLVLAKDMRACTLVSDTHWRTASLGARKHGLPGQSRAH
jgi:hypothetical protein